MFFGNCLLDPSHQTIMFYCGNGNFMELNISVPHKMDDFSFWVKVLKCNFLCRSHLKREEKVSSQQTKKNCPFCRGQYLLNIFGFWAILGHNMGDAVMIEY